MQRPRTQMSIRLPLRSLLFFVTVTLFSPHPSRGQNPNAGPSPQSILTQMYSGDLTAAIDSAHKLQQDRPDHPIGFLLEDEALSWKIWCNSAEYKYGMSYVRHRAKLPGDDHYFDVTSKIIQISEHHIAASGDTAATADM